MPSYIWILNLKKKFSVSMSHLMSCVFICKCGNYLKVRLCRNLTDNTWNKWSVLISPVTSHVNINWPPIRCNAKGTSLLWYFFVHHLYPLSNHEKTSDRSKFWDSSRVEIMKNKERLRYFTDFKKLGDMNN